MTRYRVLPYKQGSKSAKALAEALGGKVLKLEGSTYTAKPTDVVVNWGHSRGLLAGMIGPLNTQIPYVFNDWEDIAACSNKKIFFEQMRDTGLTPEFWINQEEIPDEKYPIVCRTILSGHSGAGIHVANSVDDLVDAPLYVRYVKKKEEYRAHVGIVPSGEVNGSPEAYVPVTIAVQRKARRLDTPNEEVNWQVRNLAGGFVYVREGFTLPSACEEVAHRCMLQTGLDFGAVDIIWNEHEQRAYVLEVNTAPGLEGTTVTDYANFFLDIHP